MSKNIGPALIAIVLICFLAGTGAVTAKAYLDTREWRVVADCQYGYDQATPLMSRGLLKKEYIVRTPEADIPVDEVKGCPYEIPAQEAR